MSEVDTAARTGRPVEQGWRGWLRDRLLWERWTLIDPDEMRRRRASWPLWRRSIRYVGASLWLSGWLLGLLVPGFDSRRWSGWFVLGLVMVAGIAACVIVGTALEWRDRRRQGLRIID